MIDTIKALLRGIGRAGSYLVPYRSGGRLSTLGDYLYTAWLARHFKHIGANVYIRRPVSLRGGKYISIGSHSVIQKGCILNAWDRYGDQSFTPEIAIGEHVSIGEWSHLSAIRAIRIGNYVRTGGLRSSTTRTAEVLRRSWECTRRTNPFIRKVS